MQIVHLSSSHPYRYFREIAQIHASEIHHGLLPQLGTGFLARLYFEIARASGSAVWAALEGEEVKAFLAGTADVRACYRSVCFRGLIPLSLLCARGILLSPALLSRIPSLFLYPFRKPEKQESAAAPDGPPSTPAELLAVAVRGDSQRRGIGKLLTAAFEEYLIVNSDVLGYCVTTNSQEVASNQFYRSAGCQQCGTRKHHQLILQQYYRALRK